ncbi:chromosome segregation protein SMC [Limibacter armeniacum]|uniref:chromosome segregation protein SMC n=1 Tax=Limibacter armeniacum TaxID=466084 RepID=UPI002FE5B5E0
MTEIQQKQNNKTNLLLALIVILVLLNGLQWYLNHRSSQKNQELLENKELELVTTYAKLDSISTQLDQKILELQQLNENVDSLLAIKAELEKEKQELKTSKNIAQNRYLEIKDKVEVYETLLKNKDAEIARLNDVNATLLDQTISLKKEKNTLKDEVSNLKQEKQVMSKKINVASALKAINLKFEQVSRSGRVKEDTEFKERRLDQLRIRFNIDSNPLTPIGAKSIMLRLIEPEGATLYNVSAGSGTFEYNEEEIFYTAKQEILFDNSTQEVIFNYTKEGDLKKGKYTAELYSGGHKMGEGSFILK